MERTSDFSLIGKVGEDRRLAHRLGECYDEELQGIASYLYRSIMTEELAPGVSALFDALAREEIRHFRRLGELILALGGNPIIHTTVKVDPLELSEDVPSRMACVLPRCLRESIREEQMLADRYETLLGRSGDRVVRSVLSSFATDEHRHLTLLCKTLEDITC